MIPILRRACGREFIGSLPCRTGNPVRGAAQIAEVIDAVTGKMN
jgi:hypothetical protein